MAKKGNSSVLKRLNSPGFLRLHRKKYKFSTKPRAGPHSARNSFTLTYVLRDLLGFASNAKEVKRILHGGKVLVDGKVRKDPHFPVGLMDVIELPDLKQTHRIVPDKLYNMKPVEITKDKTSKLCKILGKHTLKGDKCQLNLHDGRNVIVDEGSKYNVNDVVQIDLKKNEIKDSVSFEEGKIAIVSAGINNGRMGKITGFTKIRKNDMVTLDDQGEKFDTALHYVFVLGDSKPIIQMPV